MIFIFTDIYVIQIRFHMSRRRQWLKPKEGSMMICNDLLWNHSKIAFKLSGIILLGADFIIIMSFLFVCKSKEQVRYRGWLNMYLNLDIGSKYKSNLFDLLADFSICFSTFFLAKATREYLVFLAGFIGYCIVKRNHGNMLVAIKHTALATDHCLIRLTNVRLG